MRTLHVNPVLLQEKCRKQEENVCTFGMQALEGDALDVELRAHIDTRGLNFTSARSSRDCEVAYGSVEGNCGYLMYLEPARSLRVRTSDLI